jgi:flagellar basal body-associated protein FliL
MQNSKGMSRQEAEEVKAQAKKKTALGIVFAVLAVLLAVGGVFLLYLLAGRLFRL